MSKTPDKYITALDYLDKTMFLFFFFLSGAGSGASLFSFDTVIGTLVSIASASISLLFLINNGIVKFILKTMERKKTNIERLLY